jgi:hypothetical protein
MWTGSPSEVTNKTLMSSRPQITSVSNEDPATRIYNSDLIYPRDFYLGQASLAVATHAPGPNSINLFEALLPHRHTRSPWPTEANFIELEDTLDQIDTIGFTAPESQQGLPAPRLWNPHLYVTPQQLHADPWTHNPSMVAVLGYSTATSTSTSIPPTSQAMLSSLSDERTHSAHSADGSADVFTISVNLGELLCGLFMFVLSSKSPLPQASSPARADMCQFFSRSAVNL